MRHLPQAGAQLVDADDAVDREIRREYVTVGKNRIGEQLHIDRPELVGIRERASGSSFWSCENCGHQFETLDDVQVSASTKTRRKIPTLLVA